MKTRARLWAPSKGRQSQSCRSFIAKDLPSSDAIRAIAERAEPKLRQALLDALQSMTADIDLLELAEAVRVRDYTRILALIPRPEATLQNAFDELITVNNAAGATAALGASHATAEAGAAVAAFTFDRLDPNMIEALTTYRMDLIRQMTASTLTNVQDALVTGLRRGWNPLKTARAIDDLIGLTDSQARAAANYRRLLEAGDLSALDRQLRDRRFDPTVERAVREDLTLSDVQVDRMVARYRERMLQLRARTIARTETLRAANAGAHAGYAQMIARGDIPERSVRRHWLVAEDERTCAICNSIPILNPDGVGFDEDFNSSDGPIYAPPDPHPSCRCAVTFYIAGTAQLRRAA